MRIASVLVCVAAAFVFACGSGGGDGRFAFVLRLTGIPASDGLNGLHYECWAVVGDNARSCGKFVVVGNDIMNVARTRSFGAVDGAEFGPSITQLGQSFPRISDASHLFVTLEPEGDFDSEPSCLVILAGEIIDNRATLTPDGVIVPPPAVPTDPVVPCSVLDGPGGMRRLGVPQFGLSTGTYRFATPTDDMSVATPNDFAGVWFVTAGANGLERSLQLVNIGENWRYEGWAMVDGVARSLGRFRDPSAADEDASTFTQRGDDSPGPPFPGQDFVQAFTPAFAEDPPQLDLAPADSMAMPEDGEFRCFVTVEPNADNDVRPFGLRILEAPIPLDAVDGGGNGGTVMMENVTMALPTAEATVSAGAVTLAMVELADLAPGEGDRRGHYELWADDMRVGRFLVQGNDIFSLDSMQIIGTRDNVVFDMMSTGLPFPDPANATALSITLEPQGDNDGIGSGRTILAGAVSGGGAILTVAGPDGSDLGLADFTSATGSFRLATPSNDETDDSDDRFGVLFQNTDALVTAAATLSLPELPDGWIYEAFVEEIVTGRVYSTGRFESGAGPDSDQMTSASRGPDPRPGFPGRDFLVGVPTQAFVAAADGSITEVMVSIEPCPDNDVGPFLEVLRGVVPPGAVVGGVGGVDVPMTNTFSFFAISGEMILDDS